MELFQAFNDIAIAIEKAKIATKLYKQLIQKPKDKR